MYHIIIQIFTYSANSKLVNTNIFNYFNFKVLVFECLFIFLNNLYHCYVNLFKVMPVEANGCVKYTPY